MLSVEIRVNGQLIKVVTGVNTGKVKEAPHLTEYEIHIYDLESSDVTWKFIRHRPADGIGSLIAKILDMDAPD